MEEELGLVFDFHRGTTHDGPGMRTTVFMKGCPLHCKWCHNPESMKGKIELEWIQRKCIGCLSCVKACSEHAISFGEKGLEINQSLCNYCFQCSEVCPAKALHNEGKYWSIIELVKEVEKDDIFFREFQGGVTVSGGEPLMQYPYVARFLQTLKEKKYHTALDTCGYAPKEAINAVYPFVDVFLYDLKLFDREAHEFFTGGNNQIIIDNFLYLVEKINTDANQKQIWIRTPLIPGATATVDNIAKIGRFLKEHRKECITRWELCAFNNVCKDKYKNMRIKWEYMHEPLMTDQTVNALLSCAREFVGDIAMSSGLTAKEE